MHDAALHSPRDPHFRPGCFLAGAGLLAVLALRATPGLFAALSLLTTGLLLTLPVSSWDRGFGSAQLPRWAVFAPLAAGLLAAAGARPWGVALCWLAVYAATGAILWRVSGEQFLLSRHASKLETLPPDLLPEYAAAAARGSSPRRARVRLLLRAASRLAALGDAAGAARLLDEMTEPARSPRGRRGRWLRSVVCFLRADLEGARGLMRELLAGPVDLEEGREFRAWSAYLEIAAGCPGFAFELAEAAIGPHSIAGEAWLQHCSALQVWALEQQGYDAEAAELARLMLISWDTGGETLRTLLGRLEIAAGRPEAAAEHLAEALRLHGRRKSARPDPLLLGLQGRAAALGMDRVRADACAAAALAAAASPYARALALTDHGAAGLLLGEPGRAEDLFRRALEEWPALPDAFLGLRDSLALQGRPEEAERLAAEGARRFPQHRVALRAGNRASAANERE